MSLSLLHARVTLFFLRYSKTEFFLSVCRVTNAWRHIAADRQGRHARSHETDTEGTTQVQTHETEPGMHRVASCDLLANAVEDLGGGDALCPRAENLSETTVQLQDKGCAGREHEHKIRSSRRAARFSVKWRRHQRSKRPLLGRRASVSSSPAWLWQAHLMQASASWPHATLVGVSL